MTDDTAVQSFRVDVPQAEVDDLRERLARTRWPADQRLDGQRGLPLDQLRQLAARWADGWDWRAQEAALNRWPQVTTTIDGTTVHALHVRAADPGAPTLVLLHGWPGSVVEFARVVGPLTDPAAHGGDPADAVSLVIPSLPGYGFSGPTPDGGWTTSRMAAAVAELLSRLGVDRSVVHGGDWGSAVGRDLAVLAPDRVLGLHVTMTMGLDVTDPRDDAERAAAEKSRYYDAELAGYNRLQATRPLSIAPALTDSPAGLLAWIGERFAEWTDPGSGVLTDPALVDQVLTDVAVYWFTGTAGSSSQVYWERMQIGRAHV